MSRGIFFLKRVARTSTLYGCLLAMATVAGCKSSGKAPSAYDLSGQTGTPTVRIQAADYEPIQSEARNFFLNRGYEESESRHRHQQVFDRPAKPDDRTHALRVRLTVKMENDGIFALTGEPLVVESWKQDLEDDRPMPQAYAQIYDLLVEIKVRVESGP